MSFADHDKPDVLLLAHRVPYPLDKGDRIRNFHVVRSLARHASIHLACLADEPVSAEAMRVLSALCVRVEIVEVGNKLRLLKGLGTLVRGRSITEGAFASKRLRQVVRHWAGQTRFYSALASASSMAPYLRISELEHVPVVVDLVDVDSQKWLDYARARSWPLSWLLRAEGRRLRRLETDISQWASAATLVSEAEADLFRSFCPWEGIHAVTNGVDLEYFRPQPECPANDSCIFVGALDYFPNVQAALWFGREVWPNIRRRRPRASFVLVGRRPVPALQHLAQQPGIQLVGEVPDVRPFVNRAAVVVAPLLIARGLQNKVLEALALAKPVVASPAALAALHVESGVHVLPASSPEEWTQSVCELLANQQLRSDLGHGGRQYAEEYHDWDRCLERLVDLLGLTNTGTALGRDREFCR
jgi:sugar transferase (PEP-CTERM/EpsH1 system associated)